MSASEHPKLSPETADAKATATGLATEPLGVPELTEVLARLGRPVTGTADAPAEETALHLARVLVAAAEQQAIAAGLALARKHDGALRATDETP